MVHRKNAPTLYDNLMLHIDKGLHKVSRSGELARQVLVPIKEAKRYVLDWEASYFVGWLIARAGREILSQHEFARTPYPNTWIEIDFSGYIKGLDNRESDSTADFRVGYFINSHNTLFFASETKTFKPELMPYYYNLHRPISFEEELALAQECGLSRLTLRAAMLGSSGLEESNWLMSDAAASFCRSHQLVFADHAHWSVSDKRMLIENSAGSIKQAIALLLLLSRPGSGVISLSNQERRHGLIKGRTRVLAPHHKVAIHLSRDLALQRILGSMPSGRHNREHDVRGHWCQSRALKYRGCDHLWEPVDKDHYECMQPGCKAKRWWKKSHHRGDASLGHVTKEYEVTK